MLPPKELGHIVRVSVEPVTVTLVADEFEVPAEVAAEALRQLQVRLLEREMGS